MCKGRCPSAAVCCACIVCVFICDGTVIVNALAGSILKCPSVTHEDADLLIKAINPEAGCLGM